MPVAIMQDVADDIFLGRQPIVDRAQQLHGFELLFRSSHANHAAVTDDRAATSAVIVNTLSEFGIESVLGGFSGFINCDANFLMSDAIALLPAPKNRRLLNSEWLNTCRSAAVSANAAATFMP